MDPSTPDNLQLELSGERHLAIMGAGRRYRFTLKSITQAMWLECAQRAEISSEMDGADQISTNDITSPALWLVDQSLLSAEGYKLPPTVGKLSEMPDWRGRIPFNHRVTLADILASATRVPTDDEDLRSDSVTLQAFWNADTNGDMVKHLHLVHHFAAPSFEQERRYMRAKSQTRVDPRKQKTVQVAQNAVLAELYDELIQALEGYTLNGATPTGAELRQMDAHHKVTAVLGLFVSSLAAPAARGL